MPAFSHRFAAWIDTLTARATAAAVALAIGVLLLVAPACYKLLAAWARSSIWGLADRAIAYGALIGVVLLLLHWPLGTAIASPYSTVVVVAGLAIVLGLRLAANANLSSSQPDGTTSAAPLFDRVLHSHGLAPLQSEDEDELQRVKLLDEIQALVAQPRSTSLNFGLEGAWGSGKTSLLNLLRDRLVGDGFTTVALDLWSYREPRKLVEVYFANLATALADHAPHLRTRSLLRRLAAGLAELGGSPVAKASQALFGDLAAEPLETTRLSLAKELRTLRKPVVVFLDDLDRLDRDELVAVLRSVRLTSDLPNLTQILAYDREQIARTLFPDDPTGTRARDHIGKIVNCEFTIGTPPRELVGHLLESSLSPFFEALGDAGSVEQFQGEVRSHELRLFMEALQTPREVRRVAAATAGRWERMAGHVNPFDLFVLTIIQYRFPSVYRAIRANPEWFVELGWSEDFVLRMVDSKREALKEKGAAFIQDLADQGGPENNLAARLLDVLFPSARGRTRLQEDSARRERRIVHPGIIDRYFHLYVPEHTVTEAEIEHYAEQLKAAPYGTERQILLVGIISKEAERRRLDSFLDQWRLVFGWRHGVAQLDASLVRDLALGLAEAAVCFSEESSSFVESQCRHAAYKVLFLSFHLDDADAATGLLVDVIHRATRLSFAATIVAFSQRERRPSEYHDAPEPNKKVLEDALVAKVLERFADDPCALLSSSRLERAAVLRATGENEEVPNLFVQAIRSQPGSLPRLLEMAAPVRTDSRGSALAVDSLDVPWLASRIDLQEVHRVTAELPAGTWINEVDRELVERFRAWIRDQPVSSRGGAPVSPSA